MLNTEPKLSKQKSKLRKSTLKMSKQSTKNKKKKSLNLLRTIAMRSRLSMSLTVNYPPLSKQTYLQQKTISRKHKQGLLSSHSSKLSLMQISRNSSKMSNSLSKTMSVLHAPNPLLRKRKRSISWMEKQKHRNSMKHYKLLKILWEDEMNYWHPLKNK